MSFFREGFFVLAYHFKLLAIVWTLLTRLTRKFLDFRRDLFLTLEELRNAASQLQNIVCHTLYCFLILKLYFFNHHPNSDSFFCFFFKSLLVEVPAFKTILAKNHYFYPSYNLEEVFKRVFTLALTFAKKNNAGTFFQKFCKLQRLFFNAQ